MAPAADVWQNGNFIGVPAMDNFAAQALNSTFDIAFIQHEPSSQCTTPIDCPFTQNYDDCLRYFQKSYNYADKPGLVTWTGTESYYAFASQQGYAPVHFRRSMGKVLTVSAYHPTTGALNSILGGGSALATTGAVNPGENGFSGFSVTTPPASNWLCQYHWAADSGW
jgi:hypothetical protein